MNKIDYKFKNLKELLFFLKTESEYSLLAELCCIIGIDKQNNIIYRQNL